MTWSQRASSARGMPARTRRGRSTAPWSVGAAGSCEEETPAHLPVRAAYSRAAASTRSADRRPGGRPWRAASTPKPMIRTCPWWSTRTFSGTSRPCASPAAWARARLSATSETIHAARRGCQRSVVGQHDVERRPLAPLVDDEAEVVEPLGVQDAQQSGVEVGSDVAGRLQESLGPRVVAGDEVHGDVPVQHGVVGAPEAAALALGEQVVEAVARGEDLAGVDRVRHRSPRSRRLPAGRWTTSS